MTSSQRGTIQEDGGQDDMEVSTGCKRSRSPDKTDVPRAVWTCLTRMMKRLVPSGPLLGYGESAAKKARKEVSCGTEHTVLQLLLQNGYLDARGLTVLSSLTHAFRQACEDDELWRMACQAHWPSLKRAIVEPHIMASGGYRRYYWMTRSQGGELQDNLPHKKQIGDLFSDVLFLIDIYYRNAPVFSYMLEGTKEFLDKATPNRYSLQIKDIQDHKIATLINCPVSTQSIVGSNIFATFRSSYLLPGIFQHTLLSCSFILSIANKNRRSGEEEFADLIFEETGFQIWFDFGHKDIRDFRNQSSLNRLHWR
eukprot:jgi/Mesen1/4331/ME000022S03616